MQQLLNNCTQIIKEFLPDCKIYLFGSFAKGTAKRTSDIDIAIDNKDKIDMYIIANIRDQLEDLRTLRNFDIIDLNRVDADFKKYILSYAKLIA